MSLGKSVLWIFTAASLWIGLHEEEHASVANAFGVRTTYGLCGIQPCTIPNESDWYGLRDQDRTALMQKQAEVEAQYWTFLPIAMLAFALGKD